MAVAVAGATLLNAAAIPPASAQQAPAAQTAAQTPEGLVRDLYQNYLETAPDTDVGFDFTEPAVARRYFDGSLAALVVADAKSAEPKLDFDPFVDGQDFEIKAVSTRTTLSTGSTATVEADFENFDERKHLTFKLAKTKAGWRISDVEWGGDRQSLRQMLTKTRR
ncbi:hypothetical protein GCM10007301_00270 [Azorhizobium oxalatiphilum]|uniref:DUF3828 domain-containing protein n=1 Tax=Azorhizobium oxalatiphilum TaxID=980631 RepID=A0A917BIT7_9HYPH|nr:DUF3828 domain-containing protein [Azorhizobium oxalatiphilum]GGF44700.1 hypothetical protein GCM10007301_00270 [Azorhizobium oxalatiphilum]